MKIHLAFCVELDKVVDIHEAGLEFFAQSGYPKFNFLCSDPRCREAGIRVTAVNYARLPEETVQSPHYRELDKHLPLCEWVELEDAEQDEKRDQDHCPQNHHIHTKLTRLITRFVPGSPEDDTTASHAVISELDAIRSITDLSVRKKARLDYNRNAGSTSTSLEAFVSCFEELHAAKALDTEIQIPHQGIKTYRQIFRPVKYGATNDFAVYYGGARFDQTYGKKGFALYFMDKIDKTPISFYVPSFLVDHYRPGMRLCRMIEELIENKNKRPYLKVYWIGSLDKTQKGYSASVTSLAHVVLRLVYPVTKPPEN